MSLAQAIAQFNQQEFYQCHDTLEALWMEAGDPQRRFYQGLLQIAVAYYHWGNGNRRGCAMLLGEGLRKLQSFTDADSLGLDGGADFTVDVQPLLTTVAEHLTALHAGQTLSGIPKIQVLSSKPPRHST